MRVELESIHLNHDPTSRTTGAFSIRRNEKCPIVRPEWQKGRSLRPEDAPAAYSYTDVENKQITIKAEFSCSDTRNTSLRVRARDGHLYPKNGFFTNLILPILLSWVGNSEATNVLGTVRESNVTFSNGKGVANLTLENVKIRDIGVGINDVIWCWQYSYDGGPWLDLATTRHRIYTVVDMPSLPWKPDCRDIENTQLPWTEVLDFSCRSAASTKNVDDAATNVTLWANRLGNGVVHYDNLGNGWTGFTLDGPSRFDCTEFLLLLNGGKNLQGPAVNCDDCAAIVTSFSNVLGCRLAEGKMAGEVNFKLNPNQKIGRRPVINGYFSHHIVAWLGECTEHDPLFDACVQLDLDDDQTTQVLTVPINIVFRNYRPHLTNMGSVIPGGKQPLRTIGLKVLHKPVKNLIALKSFIDGSRSSAIPKSVLAWAILLSANEVEDLELIDFRFIETTHAEYLLQSFWSHQVQTNVSFGIDTYEAESKEQAEALLNSILERFHLHPVQFKNSHPPLGDKAYASEGGFTVVFLRDEFVFLLRNTGERPIPCEGLARSIDELLQKLKEQLEGGSNDGTAQIRRQMEIL
jgi:hypothetical protein